MKVLVTGCAGFIGSTLSERLIKEGFTVIGIDSLNDTYDRKIKMNNISNLLPNNNFEFINKNIIGTNIRELIRDIDSVFHQAATAGVRSSWGNSFNEYVENNINATQYLLENIKDKKLRRFIFASSSSVYGDSTEYPSRITTLTRPVSPYGVTKLSSENLVYAYSRNYNIPSVSLRYFTVYGPRQRPDMGFHKFLMSAINNNIITIYGDGNQTRDFTYIDDIVEANILSLNSLNIGSIYNIGGGNVISINETLNLIEQITSRKLQIEYTDKHKGDVLKTQANIIESTNDLNYKPVFDIKTGLEKQYTYIKENINLYS